MDKFKGLAKGGWHPPGDPSVSRKTWREDLKGMATGKKHDPNEEKRNHESKPLASLRDPSSFGPPPKHSAYYGPDGSSPTPSRANTGLSSGSGGSGGLGAPVPAPRPRLTQEELAAQEEAAKPPSGPYRRDTSGLRTDHLPAPPVRRNNTPGATPGPPPPPRANPGLPARSTPPPPRAAGARPPPVLPPRQNEYPDENTPPPPPTYGEATQPSASNPASLNQSALNRLGQAGVSVPGFGIGSNNSTNATAPMPPSTQGHSGQLNELQQRFSRLGTGSNPSPAPQAQPAASGPSWQQHIQQPHAQAALSYAGQQTGVIPPSAGAAAAAKKKPAPPPPPPKKSNLQANEGGGPAPPPIPMSSKPRPN